MISLAPSPNMVGRPSPVLTAEHGSARRVMTTAACRRDSGERGGETAPLDEDQPPGSWREPWRKISGQRAPSGQPDGAALATGTRPLARHSAASGALSVPGAGKVRIVRDGFGVPHVYAATERALFFGEGYAVGQDRLWQAELLRRVGTGTVAAMPRLGGPSSVASDLDFREYTGGQAHLRQLVGQLTPTARVAVQAFSDGMNAWIRTATRTHSLPPEYAAIGMR